MLIQVLREEQKTLPAIGYPTLLRHPHITRTCRCAKAASSRTYCSASFRHSDPERRWQTRESSGQRPQDRAWKAASCDTENLPAGGRHGVGEATLGKSTATKCLFLITMRYVNVVVFPLPS